MKEEIRTNLIKTAKRRFIDFETKTEVIESLTGANEYFCWGFSQQEIRVIINRAYNQAVDQLN